MQTSESSPIRDRRSTTEPANQLVRYYRSCGRLNFKLQSPQFVLVCGAICRGSLQKRWHTASTAIVFASKHRSIWLIPQCPKYDEALHSWTLVACIFSTTDYWATASVNSLIIPEQINDNCTNKIYFATAWCKCHQQQQQLMHIVHSYTHGNDSRESKEFIRICVCVCLFACLLAQTRTAETIPWAIKTCHFVFDYNSGFSWSIFILFAPVDRGRNTLHRS